ncbi:MAG: DNA ligase (NAD+) [Marinoscillum sp.]
MTGVNHDKRPLDSSPTIYITHCPECGTELIRKESEANHYCPNSTECPPQKMGRVEHFISRNAMDIGYLGPRTIKGLFDSEKINDLAGLYKLTYEDLNGLKFDDLDEETGESKTRSIKERSAQNIIEAIDVSRSKPFDNVLFGLGIRYVGRTIAEKLADHFKSIDALMDASLESLINVPEIGNRIAESVVEYFSHEKNLELINRLKQANLQLVKEVDENQKIEAQLFVGKTVVVSGVFEKYEREELKKMLKNMGGKVASSITSKTDFLIAGQNMGPAKLEKATSLGTKIITEDELIEMIASND